MKKQELTNPHAQAALAFINQDEHHGETGDLPVRYEDVESFAKEAVSQLLNSQELEDTLMMIVKYRLLTLMRPL